MNNIWIFSTDVYLVAIMDCRFKYVWCNELCDYFQVSLLERQLYRFNLISVVANVNNSLLTKGPDNTHSEVRNAWPAIILLANSRRHPLDEYVNICYVLSGKNMKNSTPFSTVKLLSSVFMFSIVDVWPRRHEQEGGASAHTHLLHNLHRPMVVQRCLPAVVNFSGKFAFASCFFAS